jgi:hypothetical protein
MPDFIALGGHLKLLVTNPKILRRKRRRPRVIHHRAFKNLFL